jgi:hypothetical protein
MKRYVKHKVWTANGQNQVIHLYEVDPMDRHLTHRGTYRDEFEMESGWRGTVIQELAMFLSQVGS